MKLLIFKLTLLFALFSIGLIGFALTIMNVIFETLESWVSNISQRIEEKLDKQ